MLYLEDFLEIIENIPQDIKNRTTDLKDIDVKVHSTSEQLDEQIKTFFTNAPKMKMQEKESTFKKIHKEYLKLLDDANEKVSIADSMHETLKRYIRKIDPEIEKFKCELEADSPGVTEILEKKCFEDSRDNQKENRYSSSRNNSIANEWRPISNSIKKEEIDPQLSSSISASPPSSVSYTLGHIGAGGTAIAAAASQAIAATQQMQQGRRSASLKASYDAIALGVHPTEFSVGSELANAAQTALAASSLPQESNSNSSTGTGSSSSSASKRQKKRHGGSGNCNTSFMAPSPVPSEELLQDTMIDPSSENPDWVYDPNEPRYCICSQVSYGDMVACDNPKCPIEWFHYPCVNITAPPKGKWYCPQCSANMSRRQRK